MQTFHIARSTSDVVKVTGYVLVRAPCEMYWEIYT